MSIEGGLMTRHIKIAAVQMEGTPQPTAERLRRAEALVAEAAEGGAQLVVLPEVFNTGYHYSDSNLDCAEPIDGPTVTWMKATTAKYQVHLAGTIFLLDHVDIYNAMLLVAPDGQTWRYDKVYPWGWERAYNRDGHGPMIADTTLGKLGMLICWDSAHPELWHQYAGQVDAMVVCSSPPQMPHLAVTFPGGEQLSPDANLVTREAGRGGDDIFGKLLRAQAANLGVPVVNTTHTGRFVTHVPAAAPVLAMFLATQPQLWHYIKQAEQVQLESDYYNETYVADAWGTVLAQVPAEQEGWVLAEVELADTPPQPAGPQPKFGISPMSYVFSDVLIPAMMVPLYRAGVRRVYGGRMAPWSAQTRYWLLALVLTGVLGYLGGLMDGLASRCRR
jgi:predicted amidohydrolase